MPIECSYFLHSLLECVYCSSEYHLKWRFLCQFTVFCCFIRCFDTIMCFCTIFHCFSTMYCFRTIFSLFSLLYNTFTIFVPYFHCFCTTFSLLLYHIFTVLVPHFHCFCTTFSLFLYHISLFLYHIFTVFQRVDCAEIVMCQCCATDDEPCCGTGEPLCNVSPNFLFPHLPPPPPPSSFKYMT